MIKVIIKFFMIVTLLLHLSQNSWAQDDDESSVTGGPRRQMAIIIFSGLAGAILGLSTLSFYGRPQDKLSNIAMGFAIGIIGGTVYTTYKAATVPKDYYGGIQDPFVELKPVKTQWVLPLWVGSF